MTVFVEVLEQALGPSCCVQGHLDVEPGHALLVDLHLQAWEWSWTGELNVIRSLRGPTMVTSRKQVGWEQRRFALWLPRDATPTFRLRHGGVYWTCSARLSPIGSDGAVTWRFSRRLEVGPGQVTASLEGPHDAGKGGC